MCEFNRLKRHDSLQNCIIADASTGSAADHATAAIYRMNRAVAVSSQSKSVQSDRLSDSRRLGAEQDSGRLLDWDPSDLYGFTSVRVGTGTPSSQAWHSPM